MGELVAKLGERGALVYALDGRPEYARPVSHAQVLRDARAVAAYNLDAPKDRRFHGIRYDVEPYLLPEFRDARRERILQGYLTLMSGISRIATAAGLAFGVDIPFWFDGYDEGEGLGYTVEFDGARRPLLDHLFEIVDDVVVMAYRTSAEGADGIVAHAFGELDAAERAGVQVFVGLEATPIVDESFERFIEASQSLDSESGSWVLLRSGMAPAPHLWIVSSETLEQAVQPSDRWSFHNLGPGRMSAEVARTVEALAPHPAFAGIAYHHYETVREPSERH